MSHSTPSRRGSTALLAETTAIIKAFERPQAVARLVASLQRFYPQMSILIADDSFSDCPAPRGVSYHRLPPDVGASGGRNYLLQRVATRYFWQLDDDFELTSATDVFRLLQPVADGAAEIVAGDCLRCKRKWPGWVRTKRTPFFGSIELNEGILRITPGANPKRSDELIACDIAPQFFIAETKTILDMGGWDEDLKTQEHEEFFVRCQQAGLRTKHRPDVTVRHWSELPPHYARFRNRNYRELAAEKLGVHTWIDMDGSVTHYPASSRRAA